MTQPEGEHSSARRYGRHGHEPRGNRSLKGPRKNNDVRKTYHWMQCPYHEPIIMVTMAGNYHWGVWRFVGLITYFGKWTYLWNEWLTSVDHKRLGIMYVIVAIVMLLRGFADAVMMRSQQALASAGRSRLPATSPLRSDLYRPRRYHDLLRGDAVSLSV